MKSKNKYNKHFFDHLHESQEVEFKTSFNDEVIISLVAFANAQGGSVYIGISDSGEIKGVNTGKETLAVWLNEIKNKTVSSLIPDIEKVVIEDTEIVIISIGEYPVKPISMKGRYYKRVKNSNQLLSVTEVVDLHMQSINSSWDAYPSALHTMDDISLDKVQTAIEIINRNQLTIVESPLSFLSKYNLIRENKITNAAYLLFKKEDCVASTIELGRFQDEITIKDTARSKTDILTQVNTVLDFVRKHINKEVIITGNAQNEQKWQYPMEAIREIVLNMIIHRDYRSTSDSIIKIFNNKIEFYNPGHLPDSISIDDLLANTYRSTPRNKLLADFFKDMGLIEKYGSGIGRIMSALKAAGLPKPKFGNISDGFMITVFSGEGEKVGERVGERVGEKVGEKLTDNQKKIISILKKDPTVSARILSEKIGISSRKTESNIAILKEKGLLKRIGSAKGGHWQVINE